MDLIDRDNLKEAIKMAITVPVDCSYDLGYNDMVLNAVKIADSIPTVDAQPVKRGKWRKRMSTPDSVKCCLCGYASVQESSYCGGCGAFMRGDADD